MPTWIGQAVRNGVVTTRYPEVPASESETPPTGRSPIPTQGPDSLHAGVPLCPAGAISEHAVDRGKCIRCARCLPAGFEFLGSVEASVLTRSALVTEESPRAPSHPIAPLAPLSRSLHVFLVDAGSCNACNLEVLALANPLYDSQRLGIFFTNSPRHADVLLVVGVPTDEMVEPLRRAYDALPAPKAVVAVGVCAISGGAFAGTLGLHDSLDQLLPVDVYVPGCPPAPVNVLDGLLRAVGRGRRDEGA